ncbi:putative pentatricopeptide repeat-containing protein At3g11460, mitochondrial isoform X2 [Papaver somniferum]|uniref:putative pentatricopeptide repeat-containing protein At3g11460, mitochondrial isoform X2 n=1 Tax=Papaver somniferum TaxID=3469 RepID=UPI000E6FC56E|nr:putative pentatricopeptide repeat-containing protein At3g11460, mitochondrial isoform X2 [Papaver somniferum]
MIKPSIISRSYYSNSWNIQLREVAKDGCFKEGIEIYRQMLRHGDSPDSFSFPFALKSCASLSLPISGSQLHSHVIKTGCEPDLFVQTSLISMYSKCSLIDNARRVFDENVHSRRLTVCYNALLAGYTHNSQPLKAMLLFQKMFSSDVPFNNITMLGVIPACVLPENIRFGYAQNGLATQVLDLYGEMKKIGVEPDPVTFVGVLSSCAHLGAQRIGFEIEQRIARSNFGANTYLTNALINMYARCGNLTRARKFFDEMVEKNIVSWTAMIAGYGMHGHGDIAIELFNEMKLTGIRPDGTAYVSVLSACSHAGLTDKGLGYFKEMERDYGTRPGHEHYACLVDLLGRAGRLQEAQELIDSMPVKPDGAVWGTLLGACKIHGDVKIAELAFERVIELEPTNVGYYVLLSNIYTNAENMEGVARVRVMIRERKLRKEPGCSYVELKGRVHLFMAGDRNHPRTNEIYEMLIRLEELIEESYGTEGKNEKLRRSEETTSTSAGVHSEKLAVAFGLLNTTADTEIVIIKNLRICGDCHLFMKVVSKVVNRGILVRDASRFHHFKDGTCSCNDYW